MYEKIVRVKRNRAASNLYTCGSKCYSILVNVLKKVN